MQDQYSRTQLLLGAEAMTKLHNSRVAVFGVGGVGGYTVEALARSGVGALDLIDDDKVCLTNLNRQAEALESTLGTDSPEERMVEHIALREAIDQLPEREKMTILLRFFKGLTQEQTARILGVSQVQISRLERRGLADLRRLLDG